jgi:hypothetical protein
LFMHLRKSCKGCVRRGGCGGQGWGALGASLPRDHLSKRDCWYTGVRDSVMKIDTGLQ